MAANAIPEGYHSLNAYLSVDDAAAAIEYYTEVFGAKERFRLDGPDGKIGHAELQIGDSVLMLADPNPQSSYRPPKELGGTTAGLLLYVEDMFWGDRFGQVTDPFGHGWQIATRTEDLSEEEIAERSKAAMAAMS